MSHYTITLWDSFYKWYYEVTIQATDLEHARKVANKELKDKTTHIRGVHFAY